MTNFNLSEQVAQQMSQIINSDEHKAIFKKASANVKPKFSEIINEVSKLGEALDKMGLEKSASAALFTLETLISEAQEDYSLESDLPSDTISSNVEDLEAELSKAVKPSAVENLTPEMIEALEKAKQNLEANAPLLSSASLKSRNLVSNAFVSLADEGIVTKVINATLGNALLLLFNTMQKVGPFTLPAAAVSNLAGMFNHAELVKIVENFLEDNSDVVSGLSQAELAAWIAPALAGAILGYVAGIPTGLNKEFKRL